MSFLECIHNSNPNTQLFEFLITNKFLLTNSAIEMLNFILVTLELEFELEMYNSKHPRTWDESLPYVQHNYNRALHS